MARVVIRWLACVLALGSLVGACSEGAEPADSDRRVDFQACGLPEADRDVAPERVPASYLLDGEVEVLTTEVKRGRVLAALGVPYSVNAAFPRFKEAVDDTTFEVLQEDNEGFEAELYLRDGKKLGSLQIRSSTCEDVVIAYLNLPAR